MSLEIEYCGTVGGGKVVLSFFFEIDLAVGSGLDFEPIFNFP